MNGNLQHDDGGGKGALGQVARLLDALVRDDAARLGDVPSCRAGLCRIRVIGPGLPVGARGVEGDERDVEHQRKQGIPEVHDDADHLDDEDEEADDGDGDIEVCQTAWSVSYFACFLGGVQPLRACPDKRYVRQRLIIGVGV